MRIVAFAATNHTQSINRQLVEYTLGLFTGKNDVRFIDLNDFECPLFSPERLERDGLPKVAEEFAQLTEWADLIVISLAEYNGSYTPVFKNILDWASTTKAKFFEGKDVLLLATSPGGRGAKTVLNTAKNYMPYMGANIVGTFSLPRFQQNFVKGGIKDKDLDTELRHIVHAIEHPFPHQLTKGEPVLESLGQVWIWFGYGLCGVIALSGLFDLGIVPITSNNIYWKLALFAATFTLIVRPIYDMFPQISWLESLLTWRKGVGLMSSGIVVGFWIARNVDLQTIEPLVRYFSADNWQLTWVHMLKRTTELTAWTLFLISNKWMVRYANALWRQLQKLAYVYFLSAGVLLTVVFKKPYAAVCLLLFFVVYQAWVYVRLTKEVHSTSHSRQSQAS